jgi:ribosomal protein S18 acetylase RimI-like enzyme
MALALRFRCALAGDIPALLELVQSAYRGEASRAGWTSEADLLDGQRTDADELRAIVSAVDGTRIVLACTDQAPLGSMLLKPAADHVYLGMIAVSPGLQGHGLGRALLAEAERITRSDGLPLRLRMTVIAQRSELIAWYVRRGYQVTGERSPFPYGEPRFGLPRRPDLCFETLEKLL